MTDVAGALVGRRIVTTRDEPGELDRLLRLAGADVLHVPLIEIVNVGAEHADALAHVLSRVEQYDWVICTSRHGASRVGRAVAPFPAVRLAAVGTRTAVELASLAGRPVDVVPERQTAADLVRAMAPVGAGQSVLLAQADRADSTLADGLRELGYVVDVVVAYSTRLRAPAPAERAAMLAADAVAFASGSAAEAWAAAIGAELPGRVVAIGPTTAAAAGQVGLQITHVAADHSIVGLVAAIADALSNDS